MKSRLIFNTIKGIYFQNYHSNATENFIQILPNKMSKNDAQRQIFNGLSANPMFNKVITTLPKLKDGEVLVKVRMTTICLSDIHTIIGKRLEPTPSVLGHEACVEIVDHKRDNFELSIGDRATFCIADYCGKCEFCLNGLSQKCVSLFKYGHASINNGSGFNGCYATHIVLRKGTFIKKLPDEIDDSLASTINCALATMINCVDQIPNSMKYSDKKAFIQGDGMLGLYGCALLNELGFSKIYCSGQKSNRSVLIDKFGGIPINNDEKLEDELNKIDCIIEVCGNSDVVEDGIKLVKPGGIYLFVGMVHPQTDLKITGEQIIRKCLTIKGIHNYEAKHLEKAVEFLHKTINKYPYSHLVSPTIFEFNNFADAIEEAKRKHYPRIAIKP